MNIIDSTVPKDRAALNSRLANLRDNETLNGLGQIVSIEEPSVIKNKQDYFTHLSNLPVSSKEFKKLHKAMSFNDICEFEAFIWEKLNV